jgi:hypothetical protein
MSRYYAITAKAYDADALVDHGVTPVIPRTVGRKDKHECDFALFCERNLIERSFAASQRATTNWHQSERRANGPSKSAARSSKLRAFFCSDESLPSCGATTSAEDAMDRNQRIEQDQPKAADELLRCGSRQAKFGPATNHVRQGLNPLFDPSSGICPSAVAISRLGIKSRVGRIRA